ncbi:MAG: hypothetical protein KJ737_19065 [Proteobacteria bacterium]|nr:hypothetical protein [Pseudomonadota bacterium]
MQPLLPPFVETDDSPQAKLAIFSSGVDPEITKSSSLNKSLKSDSMVSGHPASMDCIKS